MNRSARFHPEAEEEFLAALEWYGNASQSLAMEFEKAVGDGIDEALLDPDRQLRAGAFHLKHLRRFPYTLVYRALHDVVWIVAVAGVESS